SDLDADGDPDLLFVNSRSWPWSGGADESATTRLYLNDGEGRFTDASEGSGLDVSLYGMGVALGDADGDGLPDVFITAVGGNRLYRNLGAGRFRDVSAEAGVSGADDGWSTSAAFLDYDRDGDLDLFVTNYVQWSRELDFEVDYRLAGIGRAYGPPANFPGTQPYLYRNDGGGRFTDVSEETGVTVSHPDTGEAVGKGLAVVVEDVDDDGWPDILVANDTVRNFFFRNLGGRFEEQGVGRGVAYDNTGHATGAMGIDVVRHADGGELAVAIGNFANEMTSYYVDPSGNGLFTDEAIISGIGPASRSVLSFGLFFFDADLDGRQDLLQANGHVEDEINVVQASQRHAQPTQLFWNCGPDCARRFIPVPSSRLGDLAAPMVGRGAAYADMDGDGDLDVVLTQAGGPARLLRNDQATGHHWLRVRLEDDPPNVQGIGARVRLTRPGGVDERTVGGARSYLSQTELTLTYGLGTGSGPVGLEVIWPDGVSQKIDGIQVDREIVVSRL
ncbi:MAG: CRTAC1 family protein, partial [Gammaproteobacteria bacterium]